MSDKKGLSYEQRKAMYEQNIRDTDGKRHIDKLRDDTHNNLSLIHIFRISRILGHINEQAGLLSTLIRLCLRGKDNAFLSKVIFIA